MERIGARKRSRRDTKERHSRRGCTEQPINVAVIYHAVGSKVLACKAMVGDPLPAFATAAYSAAYINEEWASQVVFDLQICANPYILDESLRFFTFCS